MVHDRGITGSLGVGNLGIAGGEDDFPNGLQRDAIMPGVEPDQRLSSGGRTVGSRVDVDGFVDGIPRRRFQCVLYPAFGIDMIAGRFCINARAVVDAGSGLSWRAKPRGGQRARRKQKLEEGAAMIVPGRPLKALNHNRVRSI